MSAPPGTIGRPVLTPTQGRLVDAVGPWCLMDTPHGRHWVPRSEVRIAAREPYHRCGYCGDWTVNVCTTCGRPEDAQAGGQHSRG